MSGLHACITNTKWSLCDSALFRQNLLKMCIWTAQNASHYINRCVHRFVFSVSGWRVGKSIKKTIHTELKFCVALAGIHCYEVVWEYVDIFIYFVFALSIGSSVKAARHHGIPAKSRNANELTHMHKLWKSLKQNANRIENPKASRASNTPNAHRIHTVYAEMWKCYRTAIFYSRTWHFMNYVKSTWMSLSRALFLTWLVQGQCVVLARQRQQPLFYISFSSIYSYSTEQMYLTFFHLPFDHFSFGVIIPLLFFPSCLYPFQTISLTCFIHARCSVHVFFRIRFVVATSQNEKNESRMLAEKNG